MEFRLEPKGECGVLGRAGRIGVNPRVCLGLFFHLKAAVKLAPFHFLLKMRISSTFWLLLRGVNSSITVKKNLNKRSQKQKVTKELNVKV